MATVDLISLVIIDDTEFLRLGLRVAVEASGEIRVVGDFSPSKEVLAEVERLCPQVVLISMKWPTTEALEACREIRGAVPTTKVVMLSPTGRQEETLASILAGASGLVSANASRNELVRTIKVASNGGSYFDRRVTESVLSRLREMSSEASTRATDLRLTQRELSILTMIAQGYGNAEIAKSLHVATATVRNNITQIRSKLNLDARTKLATFAVQHGLIGPHQDEIP